MYDKGLVVVHVAVTGKDGLAAQHLVYDLGMQPTDQISMAGV
jgi:hypothetical protein